MKFTIVILFLILSCIPFAWASDHVLFGPQFSLHRYDQWSSVTGTNLGFGGKVVLPVRMIDLQFSANYYSVSTPESFSYDWNQSDGNVDVLYPLALSVVRPYVGAGLNISHFSASCKGGQGDCWGDGDLTNNSAAFTIVGGIRMPTKTITPAIEARYVFHTSMGDGSINRFILSLAALF